MSVTVIEIDSKESNVTDEDTDFEEPPRRKRIGWNYQNVFPSKAEIQVNGNHRDSKTVDKLENTSMDDIEVLEVKEGNPKSNRQRKLLYPASSSRKEIKDTIRTTVQSSIVKYLNVKFGRSVPEKQSKSNNHENKDEKVKENGHIDAKSPSDDSKENKDSTKDAKSLSDESKENKDSTKEMSDEDCRLAVKKFVDKWKSLGTFGNDERKIEKRLWKHYDACHPTFTHSRKFLNAIDRGTKNLTMDNIIGFLDRIIRSLKEYKSYPYIEKKKKLESVPEATEVAAENVKEEVLDEEQLKKQRKLHKIEKAMNKLMKEINKYETQEVDLDDEDNSAYLIIDRLKKKFGELDALYCKTAECSVATGRPIEKKFRYQGSRYTEINKRIEAWVNKNRTLPDYVDILNLVKKVTKQNTMPMKPSAVRKLAEDIFREVIQTLKDRREKDDLYCIYAYADGNVEMDPGDIDSELGQKLSNNEKVAKDNLEKVFKFYEEQQLNIIEESNAQKEVKKTEENGKEKIEGISDQNENEQNEKSKEVDRIGGESSTQNLENGANDVKEVDENKEEEEEEEEGEDDIVDTDDDSDGVVEDNNDDGDDDDDDDDELVIIESPSVVVPLPEDTDSRFEESDDDIKEILANEGPIYDDDEEDSEDFFEKDIDVADSPVPEEVEICDTLSRPSFLSPLGLKRKASPDNIDTMFPTKRIKETTEVVEID